ncbi:hypothetical protein O3G_MSEX006261 [Manduca sexta]|uniref:Uncharacterized protein n=1 Tax=Manduca sexta TaxID=7130 RepID=A0A922CK23_MANSE|nr:hypothetical protein O3G_MSEX006261 [Manduca sexta]KAG6449841.1 hypothetical protein O3G_MSEX006261 [Manduca sexta]
MKGLHLIFFLLIGCFSLYNAAPVIGPAPQPFLDTIKRCDKSKGCIFNDSGDVSVNNNKQS